MEDYTTQLVEKLRELNISEDRFTMIDFMIESDVPDEELEEKLELIIGGEETESLMEWLENQRS